MSVAESILKTFFVVLTVQRSTADNLALLSDTLRTHERAVCDAEHVTLACPRGTAISVQAAQYGSPAAACTQRVLDSPVPVEVVRETPCVPSTTLQYSLLQTVVEGCQKKRRCRFQTTTSNFISDLCPGARRYVEIAYKCRPYEFRSKVGCENDVLHLSCNPHSRVAVYSAAYGRTQYESVQCPQTPGVPEETCLMAYATEAVMKMCHGKRRCVLSVDDGTFGAPCKQATKTYLNVVYTCVPTKVLKDQYISPPEEDEIPEQNGFDNDYDEAGEGESHRWGEAGIPPAPAVVGVPGRPSSAPGRLSDLTSPSRSPADGMTILNSDESPKFAGIHIFYIYIMVPISTIILLTFGFIITRCIVQKHFQADETKPNVTGSTDINTAFTDSISEVDKDIEISPEPLPAPKPEILQLSELPPRPMTCRTVPNTYPHVNTNLYGPVGEYQLAPIRTIQSGTLQKGVQYQFQPQMHPQSDVLVNPSNLRFPSNQYFYG